MDIDDLNLTDERMGLPEKTYSIKAEEGLIGSIFLKPKIMSEILEIVNEEDFYKGSHKILFNEMKKAHENGKIIEVLVIVELLKKNNLLEEVGGEDTIYDFTEVVSTAANATTYARIIKEKSIQRQLIDVGEEIIKLSQNSYSSIEKIIDDAEKKIFEISKKKQHQDIIRVAELADQKIKLLDEYQNSTSELSGIPTGYFAFDQMTGGLHGSDLMILAARPAMGKTAFALNLAISVAKQNKHVLVYSLEMGNEQLFDRILSIMARIRLKSLKDNMLKKEEMFKMGEIFGEITEMPLYISDSASVNMMELKSTARRLKSEGKLDFLLIDYLQLINPQEGYRKSREQEISEISRSLKLLAKELNIPILTLSQLSRGVEQRNDKRPMLSDLRESGAIEQDADLVMFLYRDSYYKKNNFDDEEQDETSDDSSGSNANSSEGNEKGEEVELIIGKHRSGPIGTIKLSFEASYQQFLNIKDEQHLPPSE